MKKLTWKKGLAWLLILTIIFSSASHVFADEAAQPEGVAEQTEQGGGESSDAGSSGEGESSQGQIEAPAPAPETPTPEVPAPAPETPAPEVPAPAPETPTPEVPAPAPGTPTPEVPAPAPGTPTPEVPAPEVPEIKVTFYVNGTVYDTITPDDSGNITMPSNPTLAQGETFDGWFLSDGSTAFNGTSVTASTEVHAKISMAAQEPQEPVITEYKVTLMVGGAMWGEPRETTNGLLADPGEPDEALRFADAGAFLGWFDQASEGNKFDFSSQIAGDLTLYAQYAEKEVQVVTITFMVNGEKYSDTSIVKGATVDLPDLTADTSVANYEKFSGWYTDEAAQNRFSAATPVNENITLYAGFSGSQIYNISFKDEKGIVIDTLQVNEGEPVQKTSKEVRSEEGKIFKHWALEGDANQAAYEFGVNTTEKDLTFVPVFNSAYWVYYFSEGTAIDPILVGEGEKAVKPEQDPKRLGYIFKNWATKEGDIYTGYDFDTPVMGTLNLYAEWTPEKVGYEVVYWQENPNISKSKEDLVWPDDYTTFAAVSVDKEKGVEAGAKVGEGGTYENISDAPDAPKNPQVRYFEYQKTMPSVISGNGTGVVNVLYNRIVYTMNFTFKEPNDSDDAMMVLYEGGALMSWRNGKGEVKIPIPFTYDTISYSFDAKYEQDISQDWPANGSSVDISFYFKSNNVDTPTGLKVVSWSSVAKRAEGDSTATVNGYRNNLTGDIIPESGTSILWHAKKQDSPKKQIVEFYMEALPGQNGQAAEDGLTSGDQTTAGKVYVLDAGRTEENYNLGAYVFDVIPGFISAGTKRVNIENDNVKDLVYYNRQQLTLEFNTMGGNKLQNVTGILHESPIKGYQPAADPKRNRYEFAGWYYDDTHKRPVNWDADKLLYSESESKKPISTVTLFAKWESNDHIVRYYDNKGNANAAGETGLLSRQGVANNASVVEKDILLTVDGISYNLKAGVKVPGYGTFKGWYWTSEKGYEHYFSAETPVSRDYDLYAVWDEGSYYITYEKGSAQSGTVPVNSTGYKMNAIVRVEGNTGSLADGNKLFAGWKSSYDGKIYFGNDNLTIKGDTTLTAHFVDRNNSYTITYKPGFAGPEVQSRIYLKTNKDVTLSGKELFDREDYVFVNWKVENSETTYNGGAKYTDGASVTLVAQWKSTKQTVKFEAGEGGTLTGTTDYMVTNGTIWKDAGITVPTPKADTGYYFVGWNPIIPAASSKIESDLTFTAKFEAVKEITLTGASATKTYDGTPLTKADVTEESKQAVKSGDKIEVTMTPESTITNKGNVANEIASYKITRDGKDVTEEYKVALQTGTLTIEAKKVTISVTDDEKIYGDVDPDLTDNVTIGGNPGDDFTYEVERTPGEDVGSYDIIVKTPENPNYEVVVEGDGGKLHIKQAEITIKADNKIKKYGESDPAFTATISGSYKEGDDLKYTFERTEGESVNADGYEIRVLVTPGENKNYKIKVEPGTLFIEPKESNVTITPNKAGKVYGENDPALTATVTGTVGNEQLNYTVVRVEGEDAKTYELSIVLGENPNYTIKTGTNTFTIEKAKVTVSADNTGKMYGDTDPALTATVTGRVVGSDVLDYTLSRAKGEDAATYAINVTLGNNPNYDITAVKGIFTIAPKSVDVMITPNAAGKVYGDNDPALTATVTGTVGNEQLNYTVVRVEGEDADTYELSVVLGDNPNYTIKTGTNTFTIEKAKLKISADNTGKIYGDTDPALTATVTGRVVGSDVLDYTLSRAKGENAATYAINVALGNNPNYDITPVNGIFTIAPKSVDVMITPNAAGKVYGENDPALTATVTGTVGADELNYTVVRVEGEDADTYELSVVLGDNPNYTIQTGTNTFTIEKAKVKVSADNAGKIYGDTDPALTAAVTGTVVGDDVLNYTLSRAEGENAGTYAINVALGNNPNYEITAVNGIFTIAPKSVDVMITPNAAGKTYGESDPGLTATVTGTVGADELNYTVVRVEGEDADTYELSVVLGDNPNYTVQTGTNTFTIEKAKVKVSADNTGKIYGETDPELTAAVTGTVVGDDVLNYTLSRAEGENAGTYAINVALGNNPNYDITAVNGIFTIAPRNVDVMITPNTAGKVYGDTDPALTATVTGTVGNDELNYTVVRVEGEDAGTYELSIELGNNPNYTIQTETNTFTIEKAKVKVSADNKGKIYGDTDPALTAAVTGTVVGNDILDYTLSRAEGENAGTYAINVALGNNPNYDITAVNGIFTIAPRNVDVMITPNTAGKVYGDNDPALTATVTGTVGNDQLNYTVVRVEGEDADTYELSVVLGENPNYVIQTGTNTFTIEKAKVTVSAHNKGKIYGETDPALTAAITGRVVGSDVLNYTLSRAEGENAGTYAINVALGNNPNYDITAENGLFTIAPRGVDVMITPNTAGKVYGDNDPALTATVTGTVGNDELNYTVVRVEGEDAGNYELSIELGNNPNYTIQTGTNTFTIEKAKVTVSADNKGKIYGEADPDFTTTIAGSLKEGEVLDYTLSRTEGENAGTYPINVVLGSNPNYDITVINGILTIAPRGVDVIIIPDSANKVYGEEDPTLSATVSGTVNGDELDYTVERVPGENAGSYDITINLGNNPNYVINTGTNTFTINQAQAILTIGNAAKTAGAADPAFDAVESGVLGNDKLEYTLVRNTGEVVGSYPIGAQMIEGSLVNNNYAITVIPGTLTITAAPGVPGTPDPGTPETPAPTPPAAPDPTTPGTTTPGTTTPATPGTTAPTAPAIPAPTAPAAPAPIPVGPVTLTPQPAIVNEEALTDGTTPLAGPTEEIIGENDTALAAGLRGGAWALLNLILTILTGLAMIILLIGYFMGRKNKEEEDEENEVAKAEETEEEESEEELKRKGVARLLSIVPAIFAIIAFLLTEDMRNPMVFVDSWTLLMAIIALVQAVLVFLSVKKRKEEEKEEEREPQGN